MAAEFNHFNVDESDTFKLLAHFVKTSHRVKTPDIRGETVMEMCSLLFGRDYKFVTVPNMQGELCGHYPMKLVVLEYEREGPAEDEFVESRYNQKQLSQMIKYARCARCRSRFVMPVILFEGKHICRSATLSGAAEMFGRSTTDYLLSRQSAQEMGRTDMFGKFRGHDIDLLKFFDVGYICDLMVEKKKTKFKMAITSSEKVDKENRYSEFTILRMPYPGCELFKDWKANSYDGSTTVYDWGLALNDSDLDLPKSPIVEEVELDWNTYREWSLVELTQNYLKLLLKYIKQGSSGLLIHCISGWDRTPLFISLLRLSLWADGAIHKSLSATEMLYLTLGYDWYLFGHDLPERVRCEQEIMYFCFKVLRDISSEEFSISPSPAVTTHSLRASSASSTDMSGRSSQRHQSLPNTAHPNIESTLPPVTGPARVNSDVSMGIQGVLLSEDMMSFPPVGSSSSLASISSAGTADHGESISFVAGEEGVEKDRTQSPDRCLEAEDRLTQSSRSHKRFSQSPPVQPGSWVHANSVSYSVPIDTGRPTKSTAIAKDCTGGQPTSVKSNHFVGSPLLQHSSPVSVPQRKSLQHIGSVNSLGSWQVIDSGEHLKSLDASNSCCSPAEVIASPISSCHEAFGMNVTSTRCQRLDAVSRLFQQAYTAARSSDIGKGWQESGGGSGLSSIFNSLAEQVGLKGKGGKQGKDKSLSGFET